MKHPNPSTWPLLSPLAEWQSSLNAIHLWSQIIGKIRLANMPPANHYWHSTLYVRSLEMIFWAR